MPSTTKENKKGQKPPKHWMQNIHQSTIAWASDGHLHLCLQGGAENGQFVFLSDIKQDKIAIHSGKLHVDEILLELNDIKLAGFTLWDVEALLREQKGDLLHLTTIKPHQPITKDLKRYLNTRFQKGSYDHDLQHIIRENLYCRTVPCTTRCPRDGEDDGVDYKFLSVDEFMALEKSGHLLESGVYGGNHYGTPKPPKEPILESPMHSPVQEQAPAVVAKGTPNDRRPGATPSSAGKRQRNKSTIEATTLNSTTPVDDEEARRRKEIQRLEDEHGVLEDGWEVSFTEDGDLYFIDHEREITQWHDPRLEKVKPKSPDECQEDGEDSSPNGASGELPYGWEKIDDPQYGTYFIDHINRTTQYESPIRGKEENSSVNQSLPPAGPSRGDPPAGPSRGDPPAGPSRGDPPAGPSRGDPPAGPSRGDPPAGPSRGDPPKAPSRTLVQEKIEATDVEDEKSAQAESFTSEKEWHSLFTNKPEELKGERIQTSLFKSVQGFGFTIIGGDDSDEFLQIKNIVPDGPAYEDGKLDTGDVLVFVNDKIVLGCTHQDVVSIFQTIAPGEKVHLDVCRGYPLPFDPNDPPTNVVTTYAINPPKSPTESTASNSRNKSPLPVDKRDNERKSRENGDDNESMNGDGRHHGPRRRREANNLKGSHTKSLPDLTQREAQKQESRAKTPTPSMGYGSPGHRDDFGSLPRKKPEIITVSFVKGSSGFGFTVADSQYGQKIKQILAPQRCENLQEGDILLEINSEYIRDLPHTVVVSKLKECPEGKEATLVVQRGRVPKLARGRAKPPQENQHGEDNQVRGPRRPNGKMDSGPRPYQNRRDLNKDRRKSDWEEGRRPPYETNSLDRRHRRKSESSAGEREEFERNHQNREGSRARNSDRYTGPPPGGHRNKFPDNYNSRNVNGHSQREELVIPRHAEEEQTVYSDHNRQAIPNQIPRRLLSSHEEFDRDGYPKRGDPRHHEYDRGSIGGESLDSQHRSHAAPPDERNSRPQSRGWQPSGSYGPDRIVESPTGSYGPDGIVESTVFLKKGESGFGFRIVGGHEEGSQVSIGHIIPGGSADLDGRLQTGDQLLYVDGQSVVNASHHKVVTLMSNASHAGRVSLGIRRRIFPDQSRTPSNLVPSTTPLSPPVDSKSTEVVLNRKETEGFGFVVLSSTLKSVATIGRITKGSPADSNGWLKVGDRIIAINGVDIFGMPHKDIVNLIKDTGTSVTLTIGPREGDNAPKSPQMKQNGNGEMMSAQAMPAQVKSSDIQALPGNQIHRSLAAEEERKQEPIYAQSAKRTNPNRPPDQRPPPSQASSRGPSRGPSQPLQPPNHFPHPLTERDARVNAPRHGYSSTQQQQRPYWGPGGPPQRSPGAPPQHNFHQQNHQDPRVNPRLAQRSATMGRMPQRTDPLLKGPEPHRSDFRGPPAPQRHLIQGRGQGKGQVYTVELTRGQNGFGFSLRGGKEYSTPFFVLRMAQPGPAANEGQMKVGDQLISINNRSTEMMSHQDAIDAIRLGGDRVRLLLQRPVRDPMADIRRATRTPPPVFQNAPLRMSNTSLQSGQAQAAPPRQDQNFDYNWTYRSLPRTMRY